MRSAQEVLDVINQATGTTAYHRFSLLPWFPIITDGVLALAEAAGCFWLLGIIGSYQDKRELDKEFQVWTLAVNTEDHGAVVRGSNDTKLIVEQQVPYTDFPLGEIKLYLMDGVILLPSEY